MNDRVRLLRRVFAAAALMGLALQAAPALEGAAREPRKPNVLVILTDDQRWDAMSCAGHPWKYIHYPHGNGGPDRYRAELYNLKDDPGETRNLIDDPSAAAKLEELRAELLRLRQATDGQPDHMPLDDGIRNVLPKY
jgi:arylsulfatase A-like enzyme